jgi:hypothetical protein
MMMLAVAHAVIDQMPQLIVKDSELALYGAVASSAAALGTLILAIITGTLAKQTAKQVAETAESIEQAQVHHEQTFMPYIRAIEGIGSLSPTSGLTPGGVMPSVAYRANSQLSNLGNGIAVNVRIFVRVFEEQYEFVNRRTNAAPAIPPIGVRDQVGLSDWDPEAVTNTPAIAGVPSEAAFVVSYEDVFGTTYETIYDGDASVKFVAVKRAAKTVTPKGRRKGGPVW